MDLKNRKLLMIGGGAYAAHVKQYKEEKGFIVISVGKYEDSRMTGLVDKQYSVDRKDVRAIADIVRKENIDGIFVGSSEEYASIAIDVCEITNARFYVEREQWDIVSNKAEFKKFARQSGFPVIPEYHLSTPPTKDEIEALEYPVMIKPVDGSGARGLNPCYSADTFMELYEEALRFSPKKNIIVEKLVTGAEDICVCYSIQDGESVLSYSFSKEVVKSENNYVSLPIFHIYPSGHQAQYLKEADAAAKQFLKKMGLKNGTINLQGFYTNNRFMFYEAGYRMGGAQAYIITDYMNGANALKYMINYVLTGKACDENIADIENAKFQCPACNYYVELKAGVIDHIEGLDEVKAMPGVLNITQMCYPGDEILENNQIGRAVFRIHVVGEDSESLAQRLVEISRTLRIMSTNGEEMQIEHLEYGRCLTVIQKNMNRYDKINNNTSF